MSSPSFLLSMFCSTSTYIYVKNLWELNVYKLFSFAQGTVTSGNAKNHSRNSTTRWCHNKSAIFRTQLGTNHFPGNWQSLKILYTYQVWDTLIIDDNQIIVYLDWHYCLTFEIQYIMWSFIVRIKKSNYNIWQHLIWYQCYSWCNGLWYVQSCLGWCI